jgi:hypothetical protein
MIGGLIAVALAIWFYRTALANGMPALQWGIAGVVVYYIPNFFWSLMVAKPVLQNLHQQTAPMKYSFWGYSSVMVGLAVAVAVWYLLLNKKVEQKPE